MANNYTQLHVHAVFATKYRMSTITETWRDELCKYMTGILKDQKHRLLAIYAMPDHVHFLVGMHPTQGVSDMMEVVKSNSSKWVNKQKFCDHRFEWQVGYGAFSCSRKHVDMAIRYILNQPAHHKKQTFLEEYKDMLKLAEIEYDEKYIFKELE